MPEKQEFTFDVREFAEALRLYEEATSKEMAEVINKKARDVCFTAAKLTPRAKPAEITKFRPKQKPSLRSP